MVTAGLIGGVIPTSLVILAGGVFLDLIFGEPPEVIHPVVWIGRTIDLAKNWFSGVKNSKTFGCIIGIFLPILSGGAAYLLIGVVSLLWVPAGLVISAFLVKSTISVRNLIRTTGSVGRSINSEPEKAREDLVALVGRDRSKLSPGEMRSAAIESLFENLVDSLISSLFYFFLGSLVNYGVGVAFALVYKAVNTLDSMIGYRTEDLRNFGFLAARLDDLLNWLPSRISVLFVSLGALSWNTFVVAFRDWDCARSPNSGWPMAAAAGGLKVKLVKKGEYTLGDEYRLPEEEDLRLAIGLAVRTISLYFVTLLGISLLFL